MGFLESSKVWIVLESIGRHQSCPPRNFRAAADDEDIEGPMEPQVDMSPEELYVHSEMGLSVRVQETVKPEGLC